MEKIDKNTLELWRMPGWEVDRYETMLNPFGQVLKNIRINAKAIKVSEGDRIVRLIIIPLK